MVIGLNHCTAPLEMRERFWIGENRRYEALRQLHSAEGVDEVVVLSTCSRTEFWFWAAEPTLAANSLLQFLGSEHGLKLTEWEHFYRRLNEDALAHVFRVTSGLDSLVLGNPHITAQVRTCLEQAQTVGTARRFLSQIIERGLRVRERVHQETELSALADSIPYQALELGRQIFGSLHGRKVLLLGTSMTSDFSPRAVAENELGSVIVIDQSPARAKDLAAKLGGTSATLADRWKCMLRADIVISATGCPHVVLTRDEAERIAIERNRVPLMIVDIGMPRDVDPNVRKVDGILLYDLDGLERAEKRNAAARRAAVNQAETIIAAETQAFRTQLQAERAVPTSVALRSRLEELCRQDLESFIAERGPFTPEQSQSLHAITSQVIRKIASSLTRELKEFPEKAEQERMTAAVTRLFHLDTPQATTAGTRSQKGRGERGKERVAAM